MNQCACGCGALVQGKWKRGHNPKLLGRHHSPETRRKISEANLGKQAGEAHPNFGKTRSPETRQKVSEGLRGHVVTEETRRKISATKLAKGASLQSQAVHQWLSRWYPKTGICEHCGAKGKTHYASINEHQYTRERSDYKELCPACHLKLDYGDGQRPSQAGRPKPRRQ